MSEAQRDALRPMIDQQVADYVDAALAVAVAQLTVRLNACVAELRSGLEDQVALTRAANAQSNALASQVNDMQRADGYALTRSALIRALSKIDATEARKTTDDQEAT